MHYNTKKILCTTALALVLGLMSVNESTAQGVLSLNAEALPALDTDKSKDGGVSLDLVEDTAILPGEDALFDEKTPEADQNSGIITPPMPKFVNGVMVQGEANPPLNTPRINNGADSQATPPSPDDQTFGNNKDISSFEEEEIEIEAPTSPISGNDENLLEGIDNKLFSQMSDLEKQTALLTLELRREKIRNEIEAIKVQRKKATDEEADKVEAKRRQQAEWKNEQDKKLLVEQQKLRNIEITMEKLRQEKLLKSYKEKMLNERQKWISGNSDIYKRLADEKSEKQVIIDDLKTKLTFLSEMADKTTQVAAEVKDKQARDISELQTQISILKSRLEAEEKSNPFADAASTPKEEAEEIVKLTDVYAVMEIRGKGSNLIAKLINKDGKSFFAQAGTALQTGHVVDEITQTYVRADKAGFKEYIYFSAGGILEKEPASSIEGSFKDESADKNEATPGKKVRSLISSSGVPGISQDMTVR